MEDRQVARFVHGGLSAGRLQPLSASSGHMRSGIRARSTCHFEAVTSAVPGSVVGPDEPR